MGSSSLFESVREALNGEDRDYTEGSLSRAIGLLAIPMILETAMESLFAVVDIFFVARLGDDAVATVGLTESLLTFVFAIAMGLSFATTAFVARRIGEKDPAAAARGAVQSILIGLVASVIIGAIGVVYAPELLALMGASTAVQQNSAYTRVAIGGSASVMLLFLLNAIFRGAGDAVIAMKVLWFGNIINMILNPCLIFGLGPFPEMGVMGSAVGTLVGRSCAVGYQCWELFRGSGRIHLTWAAMRFDRELMGHILKPATSGMFQIFVATASWTALVRIASTFGSEVLAGYTIAIRVVIFSILPSWGLCNAAATLVGQNLGAKKPERAEAAVWQAGRYNMWFLGSLSVVFLIFAESILGIFTSEAAVIGVGADCLRFVCAAYVFLAYGMMMEQAFNGAGDTYTPTMINLGCYWALQIPLAWTLAVTLGYGPRGVFSAITVAETSLAIVAVLLFRRGRWKTQQI
jgi:putative MATE family efflux protein